MDALEVFNGRNVFPIADQRAMDDAQEFGYGMTAGSDAHTLWEIGKIYVLFEGNFEKSIKKGKVAFHRPPYIQKNIQMMPRALYSGIRRRMIKILAKAGIGQIKGCCK